MEKQVNEYQHLTNDDDIMSTDLDLDILRPDSMDENEENSYKESTGKNTNYAYLCVIILAYIFIAEYLSFMILSQQFAVSSSTQTIAYLLKDEGKFYPGQSASTDIFDITLIE